VRYFSVFILEILLIKVISEFIEIFVGADIKKPSHHVAMHLQFFFSKKNGKKN